MKYQAVQPRLRFVDNNGNALSGGKVYTYATGTSTPLATYTDAGGSSANANPVILDSRGEADIWLTQDVAYRFVVKTSADVLIDTTDDIWSIATTAGNTSFTSNITGAVTRTVDSKLKDWISVQDVGITPDGSTDNTTALINLAGDITKLQIIPPNTKFNRKTLIDGMPTDVVFLDLSVINDFTSAGETTKHIGIISGDEAVNDTHWSISSGHHAVLALNNFGASGTASATARKGSIVWNVGQYQLGSTDKRGFRIGAMLQFTNDSGQNYWMLQLRSEAPWESIAGEYEIWSQGQTISGANVYRVNGDNHYKSTGAGTTGSTAPTHTSGTVSDGGVSWTWVGSSDISVLSVDQYGRILIGTGSFGDTFTHRVSGTDPNGSYVFSGVARGVSKSANLKLTPTNGSSVETAVPFVQASASAGLSIIKSDGTTSLATFTDTGAVFAAIGSTYATADTATGATPSVAGRNTYYIGNAGAQTITGFTGGFDGQRVRVIVTNANTSFTNSATFNLAGSTNLATPSAFSVIDFEKVPASISDRWIETGRSLK